MPRGTPSGGLVVYRVGFNLTANTVPGSFVELPIDQIVVSLDMKTAIEPDFQSRLFSGNYVKYESPINADKLRTVAKDYEKNAITPINATYWSITDDEPQVKIYKIADGRHRFIWYVNNNFGRVPVHIC